MEQLDDEASLDFIYVSMVYGKVLAAWTRLLEFNIKYTPTVYFDGGYKVQVGASTVNQAKTVYTSHINSCTARDVVDIDLDLEVRWLGNATMEIVVTADNNHFRDYNGEVKVHICELQSSLGWRNYSNKLYRYPFLAYAIDETVSITPGGLWQNTVVWNGNDHDSGYGQGYGNIQRDNIVVVAVANNDIAHTAYSNPPSGNPFDAYYVDDAVKAYPVTLWSDVAEVPEAGGTVNFTISAEENQGRNYILVGGASGTDPGTPLPGGLATLPINMDWFTDVEWVLLNTANFANFLGVLDANGQATPQLVVPPIAGAAGTVLYFSATCNNPFDFVSNVVEFEIVP